MQYVNNPLVVAHKMTEVHTQGNMTLLTNPVVSIDFCSTDENFHCYEAKKLETSQCRYPPCS